MPFPFCFPSFLSLSSSRVRVAVCRFAALPFAPCFCRSTVAAHALLVLLLSASLASDALLCVGFSLRVHSSCCKQSFLLFSNFLGEELLRSCSTNSSSSRSQRGLWALCLHTGCRVRPSCCGCSPASLSHSSANRRKDSSSLNSSRGRIQSFHTACSGNSTSSGNVSSSGSSSSDNSSGNSSTGGNKSNDSTDSCCSSGIRTAEEGLSRTARSLAATAALRCFARVGPQQQHDAGNRDTPAQPLQGPTRCWQSPLQSQDVLHAERQETGLHQRQQQKQDPTQQQQYSLQRQQENNEARLLRLSQHQQQQGQPYNHQRRQQQPQQHRRQQQRARATVQQRRWIPPLLHGESLLPTKRASCCSPFSTAGRQRQLQQRVAASDSAWARFPFPVHRPAGGEERPREGLASLQMKIRKGREIRLLSTPEIEREILLTRQDIARLQLLKRACSSEYKPHQLKEARHFLAQLLTIRYERHCGINAGIDPWQQTQQEEQHEQIQQHEQLRERWQKKKEKQQQQRKRQQQEEREQQGDRQQRKKQQQAQQEQQQQEQQREKRHQGSQPQKGQQSLGKAL